MRRLCADLGGTGGHIANMQVQPHKADLDHDSRASCGAGRYYYQAPWYVVTWGSET